MVLRSFRNFQQHFGFRIFRHISPMLTYLKTVRSIFSPMLTYLWIVRSIFSPMLMLRGVRGFAGVTGGARRWAVRERPIPQNWIKENTNYRETSPLCSEIWHIPKDREHGPNKNETRNHSGGAAHPPPVVPGCQETRKSGFQHIQDPWTRESRVFSISKIMHEYQQIKIPICPGSRIDTNIWNAWSI